MHQISSMSILSPRQIPHPKQYQSPLPLCQPPTAHFYFPQHFGSFYLDNREMYSPFICLLWQSSQKWVFPQQNHCATEQQNRHLNEIYYFPCFVQSVVCCGQHEGQISYLGLNFSPYFGSPIASAQLFLPPKQGSWH